MKKIAIGLIVLGFLAGCHDDDDLHFSPPSNQSCPGQPFRQYADMVRNIRDELNVVRAAGMKIDKLLGAKIQHEIFECELTSFSIKDCVGPDGHDYSDNLAMTTCQSLESELRQLGYNRPTESIVPTPVESAQSKLNRLRNFLGPEYESALRDDTCENVKDAVKGAERDDAKALATGYVEDHIQHIYAIYLTSMNGVRYVEEITVYPMDSGRLFLHRKDGQDCRPGTEDLNRTVMPSIVPGWDLTRDNELIIHTSPKIRIKKVDGKLSLTVEGLESNSHFPLSLDWAGYQYPANNMPYCDHAVWCDSP